jgi:hypothetical protein
MLYTQLQKFMLEEKLKSDQIYSADNCALYWKGLLTRTLAFEKEKYLPGHKSSEECFTVMNQANASGNHKMKHTVACRPIAKQRP